VRSRVSNPCPIDQWYDGNAALIVFDLNAPGGKPHVGFESTQVIFAVDTESARLLAARLIESDTSGAPVLHDLLGSNVAPKAD